MDRLLIFDTHPIQYRSPVFSQLFRRHNDMKVFFFNAEFDDSRWWFHEIGKNPAQKWGLPLQQGFPNETLGTAQWSTIKTWRTLSQILKRENPSRVAIYGYYLPEHWILRVLCALNRIPLIFVGETFQSGGAGIRRWIKMPLRAFFFRGVWRFIAIGRKTQQYYRRLGLADSRIVSAKYCVDLTFFKQCNEVAQRTRLAWRQRHGIPNDAFVILFVGRLFERKRPRDVLEIHKALAQTPGTYSVIVGTGPLEAELKRTAQGIDRLIWLGFQNQAGTRDAYYGADVLLVPSQYETWGLVVNEASACGLPTVLTDTCGVAGDLVVHGETGFVYKRGDTSGALHWLSRLKEDRALCRKLGLAAKEKVEKSYSIEQFADVFASLLPTPELGRQAST